VAKSFWKAGWGQRPPPPPQAIQMQCSFTGTDLVCIRYINRLSTLCDVAHDPCAPWNFYFLLLLHLLQCRTGAHVKQLGHQEPGPCWVPRTWQWWRICSEPLIPHCWIVKFRTHRVWWLWTAWPQVVAGTSRVVVTRPPVTLNEEQGSSVSIKKHAHVLEDLVTQWPHIQFITDVLHLETNITYHQLVVIPNPLNSGASMHSTERCL